MSGDGIVWATAVYRVGAPGIMHVTGDGVDEDADIQVGLGEKPTTRAVTATAWTVTPGQQWRETGDGAWETGVYRHG